MRSIETGGTDHNGTDPGSSSAPGRGEVFEPQGVPAPPLDHHLEEVLEALSELAVAEAGPGTEPYLQS